jgi:hypothetical protein
MTTVVEAASTGEMNEMNGIGKATKVKDKRSRSESAFRRRGIGFRRVLVNKGKSFLLLRNESGLSWERRNSRGRRLLTINHGLVKLPERPLYSLALLTDGYSRIK